MTQAHNRHFKRFRDAAVTVEADFDARTLLRAQAHDAKKPAEGQLSKRAQKRVRPSYTSAHVLPIVDACLCLPTES